MNSRFSNPTKIQIVDPIESNGAVPVNIQDQTTPPFDLYFIQPVGPPTTIAIAVTINDTDIEVASAATISVGNYLGVFRPADDRFFFAEVLGVAGTTITVDTPADFAFQVGDNVLAFTRNLNVVGSLASPLIFEVQGTGSGDLEVDITRIMFTMILAGAPDDGLFGNLAALTNGLVLRRVDGEVRNLFNVKTNGDLANLAYDVDYTTRTVPAGSYSVRCRYSLAGQDKHGVVVRLAAGESLEVWIQDDLSALSQFRIIAEGHIVTD